MDLGKIYCIYISLLVSGMICDERIDIHNLMKQYFLVCGPDYFCGNVTAMTGFNVPNVPNYAQMSICPRCECDSLCVSRGDCCPDLYFTFPTLTCVNRTLVDASDDIVIERTKQRKRLMVDTCPIDSDNDVSRKCSSTDVKFKFLNQPVTDMTQNIVYANRYCAECNFATNITGWDIDIRCDELADFNFLSTIDEIIDYAYEKKCIIQSIDEYISNAGNVNAEICMDMDPKSNLTTCNLTGAWINYDKDIQTACESDFFGHFRHFKNVFCYMCNPTPVKSKTYFESCNKTGVWPHYNGEIQRLCDDMPASPYTHPFKNIFCYLCNQGSNRNGSFIDVNGDIKEVQVIDEEGKRKYQYSVDIHSFNALYLQKIVDDKIQTEPNLRNILKVKDPFQLVKGNDSNMNLTSFFMHDVSQFGDVGLCPSRRPSIPMEYTKQCVCEPHCVFSQTRTHLLSNCCTDARLDIPVTCRNELDLSPDYDTRQRFMSYLVINGCFQENSHIIFDRECKTRNKSDIFGILPLTTRRTISYNSSEVLISYDNVYCSICNLFSPDYISELNLNNTTNQTFDTNIHKHLNVFASESLMPWDLEIVCSQFLPIQFNVLLGDLIEAAQRFSCRIRYEAKSDKSSFCVHIPQMPHFDCSSIANWTFMDDDTKWACQETSTFIIHTSIEMSPGHNTQWDPDSYFNYRSPRRYFTNKYCSVCKPEVTLNDDYLIDTCNATGFAHPYTTELEKACKEVPQTYYYYPFKNIYCVTCNNMLMASYLSDGDDKPIVPFLPIPGVNWFPILRNMFSLDRPEEIKSFQSYVNCSSDEVYDNVKKNCIKINCYPGKYRQHDRCLPLLRTTKNLQYTMSLGAQIFNVQSPKKTDNLMKDFATAFSRDVSDTLGSPDSVIKSIHYSGSNQCHEIVDVNGSLSMNVSVTLFIEYAVIRNDVEQILLEALNTSRQGTLFYRTYPTVSWEQKDELLPVIFPPGMQNCIMGQGYFKNSWKSLHAYKKIEVSNVLLCVYVILHEDELLYDGVTEKLLLTRNNKSLEYGTYQFLENKSFAVCKEELEDKEFFGENKHAMYVLPNSIDLWRTQIVCTVISCICLAIAIAIYCMFPHLRSVPGIINMVTFSTLLVTLVFSQTGYLMIDSSNGCKIFGICLHFSWLCVFTTMYTCNFHMNRVFRSSVSGTYPDNICHMFAAYSVFSFGTPTLLVVINIIYSEILYSSIGYGGPKCFIATNVMLIATFLVPVALIILTNILLFISTSVSICKTPKANNSKGERRDFGVVIRIATITGLTWVLQITDMFFPQSAFTYVATVLSSLQGLFVFLAFMVNARVYHLVQKRLSCKVWKLRSISNNSYTLQTKFSEIS